MIVLAFPWALLLLPLPWIFWRFLPPYRQTVPSIRIPFFHRIAEATGASANQGSVVLDRERLQMIVALLVWFLLVLALARPERIGEPVEMTKAARDLVLAIDISGSMDERDFRDEAGQPLQRLAAVKEIVGEFVERREGDRVSLIVFGSKAFVQAPFTEDLRSVSDLLNDTEVGMAGPNTVIGDAIGLAIRTFESSEVDQRLMILLSDGADTNSRMSPVNAAEIAAKDGVTIHAIAVGDPAGEGENRVDVDQLRDIASRAGGEFFFADDADELAKVYARIDELAPRKVETLSFRPRQPLTHVPLIVAALLALGTVCWLHFSGRRRGRA
ncbi:VWA domain-containing protein [Rhodobacteraceae bacterium NNCM2]|nr:VWA domain-containing protein [Coraliihabitans acroporae]